MIVRLSNDDYGLAARRRQACGVARLSTVGRHSCVCRSFAGDLQETCGRQALANSSTEALEGGATIVVVTLCPKPDDAWGSLVRSIDDHGVRAAWVLPDGDAADRADAAGARVVRLPLPPTSHLGAASLSFPLVVKALTELAPALVQLTESRRGVIAASAAKLANVPVRVGVWTHGADAHPVLARFARGAIRGHAALVDRVIAMHRGAVAPLLDAGVSASRIVTLDAGWGVALDGWLHDGPRDRAAASARARTGLDDATHVVGIVGGGEALAVEIRRQIAPCALITLDDRPAPWATSVRSSSSMVDRVLACDVVVVAHAGTAPSTWAMRAAITRTPVVAPRSIANASVVRNGDTGVLVAPEDGVAGLADAVRSLLEAPGRREVLGARARTYGVRLFDRDLSLRRVLEAYDALLAEPGAPATLRGGAIQGEAAQSGPVDAASDGWRRQTRRMRDLLRR